MGIATWVKQVLYGAGVVSVLSLFFVGYHYGAESVRQNQREAYTNSLEEVVKNYESTQNLLNAIAQNQQVTLSEIRAKQESVKEDVKAYGKTVDGSHGCLDDKWVQLYNQSTAKAAGTTSRVEVDGGTTKTVITTKESK